ncbi:MAG: Rrf2 family transcriptional regulator [Thermomicrobiales bacterium]|nr:Rrf2 family transcriptional regulator [Thermomicrobiales bacterium]
MRVSSRADYGVRALFELAMRAGQGPIQSKEIAARQEIPEAYLHQVLGALNRAGLIRSTRGPLGGHELALEPSEISVFAILVALDGVDQKPHPHPDGIGPSDVVHQVWHQLQEQSEVMLSSITLQTLVDRQAEMQPRANYVI